MTLEEKRMMIMVLVHSCTNTCWNSKIYTKRPKYLIPDQADKQTEIIPDEILSKCSSVLMTLEEKRMMIMVLVRSCTYTRWNSKIYALFIKVPEPQIKQTKKQMNVKNNSGRKNIRTQLCADDFGREKDDDYGARSFLHKYTLEFQDLCTVGIVVKAITLLEFEIRITPNYWKTKRPPHYLLTWKIATQIVEQKKAMKIPGMPTLHCFIAVENDVLWRQINKCYSFKEVTFFVPSVVQISEGLLAFKKAHSFTFVQRL